MGFPRQEYWSGLPFPPWGDIPNPDWTQVSCTDRRILHHWATGEELLELVRMRCRVITSAWGGSWPFMCLLLFIVGWELLLGCQHPELSACPSLRPRMSLCPDNALKQSPRCLQEVLDTGKDSVEAVWTEHWEHLQKFLSWLDLHVHVWIHDHHMGLWVHRPLCG